MAAILGLDAKAYVQADVAAGPFDLNEADAFATWAGSSIATPPDHLIELSIVRDFTLSAEKAMADVTTRAGAGWRQQVGTLKDGSAETQMVWDPTDDLFKALFDAFLENTSVNLFISDQGKDEVGSQGLWAPFSITNMTRNEELEGALIVDARFNITSATSANPVAWIELVA